MLLQQVAQPVVPAVHPHLERRHGRARQPRDLLVRQSFHVLQHEHFTLLGRQVPERPLQRARALGPFHVPVGAVGPRERLVPRFEQPPLGETAVAQDQEQPPRKLVRLAAGRQVIERPHQSVLHRVFRGVTRAQHPCRVAGVAVTVALHERRVPLHIARQNRSYDLPVRRLVPQAHPESGRRRNMHRTPGATSGAGNGACGKESRNATSVTPCPTATSRKRRYPWPEPAIFMANIGGDMTKHKTPPAPDRSLVKGMANGDAEALRELVRRHGATVYALAYGILVDGDDAEGVVGETFDYAWRMAARFIERASGSVFAWLTEIARSRARGVLLAREWPGRLVPVRGRAGQRTMEVA